MNTSRFIKPVVITFVVIGVVAGGIWGRKILLSNKTEGKPGDKTDGSTIVMVQDGFSPDSLTVKVGTTVKFVNRDTYWHWPASDPHPSHTFYSELDPKQPVKPGDTWSVTLTKPGKWGIHDHLAPYVIGTVTVTP